MIDLASNVEFRSGEKQSLGFISIQPAKRPIQLMNGFLYMAVVSCRTFFSLVRLCAENFGAFVIASITWITSNGFHSAIFNVLLKPFVFYFAHLNGTMRPFGNGYWLHFRRIFSRRVANHIKTLLFLRASFISIFCVCVSVGYNFFRHIWRCCCWLGSGARFPNVAVFNLFVHAKQQLLSEFSLLFLTLSLSIASLHLSLSLSMEMASLGWWSVWPMFGSMVSMSLFVLL